MSAGFRWQGFGDIFSCRRCSAQKEHRLEAYAPVRVAKIHRQSSTSTRFALERYPNTLVAKNACYFADRNLARSLLTRSRPRRSSRIRFQLVRSCHRAGVAPGETAGLGLGLAAADGGGDDSGAGATEGSDETAGLWDGELTGVTAGVGDGELMGVAAGELEGFGKTAGLWDGELTGVGAGVEDSDGDGVGDGFEIISSRRFKICCRL
jgi:hypothetical protein